MMPERLSCCDCAFPRLSHAVALAVAKDLGFDAVDICVFAGESHTSLVDVIDDPSGAADAVRRRLDGPGLVVADVFAILSDSAEMLAVNHPDAGMREDSLRQFRQIAAFAALLEAPGITVLPGVPFPELSDEEALELAAEPLQRRAEIAGAAGMGLSFEPHLGSIVPTPGRTLDLLSRAPDVGVTLDLSHFLYQGIPQEEAHHLVPRTRHVHLRPAGPDDMQARTGEGTVDFEALIQRLAEVDYGGYLAFEFIWMEWLGCTDVDCVSETAALRERILASLDRPSAAGAN